MEREGELLRELVAAIREGNLPHARGVVARGAPLGASTGIGRTPLHWAAFHGDAPICAFLLEAGADPKAAMEGGRTPLHEAAFWSDEHSAGIFRSFADAGADLDVRDALGRTPLSIACSHGNASAARALLDLGADPRALDRDGRSPLDCARENPDPEIKRIAADAEREALGASLRPSSAGRSRGGRSL